ncbi:hypothetical protein K438DRAFT_1084246 [Mycena galopus ATCC 62051]|nr:hypothetical protein K438DRAFT_1084246 [Mycena galopus ATCC 62051]
MTADGRRRVSAPGAFEGPKALAPTPSKRTSRGFFSLFSVSKAQPQPLAPPLPPQARPMLVNAKLQRPRSSHPSNQSLEALPQRFDAISLTSPLQREDPAFSQDPGAHQDAHPFMPRDAIRTARSAPDPAPRLIGPAVDAYSKPVASQQRRFTELQEKSRENVSHYASSSQASESSLTLDSSPSVSGHSTKSPSSSSYYLPSSRDDSRMLTPTHTIPVSSTSKAREDSLTASPVVEKDDERDSKSRPLSPPPEYEFMASPHEMLAFELPLASRPKPFHNDSAPELHRIEPPALPHRSATTPNLGSAPSASVSGLRRPTNDRKQQAYDLDRIDELDESNPLGMAMHHEGPFEAIASILKAPQSQPPPPQIRVPKAPKPGSLGISPGQVLPPNFPYLYNQQQQSAFRQDYDGSSQASTSYIPPQSQSQFGQRPQSQFGPPPQSQFGQPPPSQFGQPPRSQFGPPPQSQFNQRPQSQFGQPASSQFEQRPQSHFGQPPPSQSGQRPQSHFGQPQSHFGQPQYGQSDMRAPLPPHEHPHPPPPAQPPHSHFDGASYTQYDPVDPAQLQSPAHTGNSFYPESRLRPPGLGHHATYSSEDNADAYGGIEVDPTPKRERYSAPPPPTASQMEPHYAQNGDPRNGFSSRRHTIQTGYPPPDPNAFHEPASQLNAGQNFSNVRHSPNPNGQPIAGVLDPRIFQNHGQLNAGQNLSSMRHSPNANGQPVAGQQQNFPPPQAGGSGSNHGLYEQDRRRPSSYQPQPNAYGNHGPMQQHPPPMPEHDPRRRASYQPVPAPPGAAPADLARQEYERIQHQQRQLTTLAQDRPQSVIAPSTASTTNPLRLPRHTPKHLVMPTPLQQSSPLPGSSSASNANAAYPNGHYESPNSSQTRLPLQQAQPTRAQTIQMDGNRHLLKKKMSAVQKPAAPKPPPAPVMPPKAPPVMRQRSYMEPPPTVPEPPINRPVQQKEKRSKRLLSKRRSDL